MESVIKILTQRAHHANKLFFQIRYKIGIHNLSYRFVARVGRSICNSIRLPCQLFSFNLQVLAVYNAIDAARDSGDFRRSPKEIRDALLVAAACLDPNEMTANK